MTVSFQSKLFGVEDDDKSKPFGTTNPPVWTRDTAWTMNCPLGECGMETSAKDG